MKWAFRPKCGIGIITFTQISGLTISNRNSPSGFNTRATSRIAFALPSRPM